MLPNLIIIGAPKAGTTSLHQYLSLHPQIAMTAEKELRYFWRDDWREQRSWYESQFTEAAPVRGESTPAYAAYPHRMHVPERMHALVPDAKLIYVVRDPVERLLSHWVQRRADGDRTSFRRCMDDYARPDNPVICPSRYWTQLQRFLRYYAPERILVIDQQDLKERRADTMRDVFAFLGVDEGFESAGFTEERNTHADKTTPRAVTARLMDRVLFPLSRRVPEGVRDAIRAPANRLLFGPPAAVPSLTPEDRTRLTELLAPEVAGLREFTGRPFASWSL